MPNPMFRASLTLMIGGALWGLLWIPLRAIEAVGVEGAWATLVLFVAPSVVLLPLSIYRWRIIRQQLGTFLAVALFCGVSFTLYGMSLLLTEVNRAILLFYLTPLWGTLIGVFFLSERLTVRRVVALGLGLIGLLVVLDIGVKLPWPRNVGDWMGLIAGMTWAIGSTVLFRSGGVKVLDQASSFVLGGAVCTIIILVIAGGSLGSVPTPEALVRSVPTSVLMALTIPPILMMTIWPITLLAPGRAGILLMTEVIFGLGSAWLIANEVLGPRELIGAALILSATVIEISASNPSQKAQSSNSPSNSAGGSSTGGSGAKRSTADDDTPAAP